MHDAIEIENAGIPAAVIVLDVFKELALMKRRHMGRADFQPVMLPGALTSPEVARAKAGEALEGVVRWLTKGAL